MSSTISLTGGHNYFYLRRLHSLFGVIPIGVFLFVHFLNNSFIFGGVEAFDRLVETFQGFWLTPFLELGGIALPIFFHLVLGLIIAYTGHNNMVSYTYYRNWAFFVQRATGVYVFIFIVVHVWATRLSTLLEGRHVTHLDMQKIFTPGWARWFYILGIAAAAYHLTNGVCTALMTWGVTVSRRSQRIVAGLSVPVCLFLVVWGIVIMYKFLNA